MMNLYLVGAGGHCHSCIDVVEQEKKYAIQGLFDLPARVGEKVLNYPILGTDDDFAKYVSPQNYFLITLGQVKSAEARIRVYEKLKNLNAQFAVVVSPRAYVSKHSHLGAGTIVLHGGLVNAGSRVGVNCILNSQALIEHDAIIEDHCHISTGAIVNGGCQVGAQSFVGSQATLRHSLKIPMKSFVQAGKFVNRAEDLK